MDSECKDKRRRRRRRRLGVALAGLVAATIAAAAPAGLRRLLASTAPDAATVAPAITTGGTTMTTGGVTTTTGGTTTTVAGTEQPATFFAVVRFDGNGNVIAQTVGASSPLASFQLTGSYTVNLDCSGSMTLNTATTSTGSATGTPLMVSFVLTPPAQYQTPGAIAVSGYSSRPGIEFTAWNSNETFFGFGTAQ